MLPKILIIILSVVISLVTYAEEGSFKFKKYEPQIIPEDVVFYDKDGEKHNFEQYEGQTILLVFWATWCAPCVNEMVSLNNLQRDFRKLPFVIIPVSEDGQGIEHLTKFYKEYDLTHLPIFYDSRNELFKAFNINGLPTSIIITPKGENIASFQGEIKWHDEAVREILLDYIPGSSVKPPNSFKEKTLQMVKQSDNLQQESNGKSGKTEPVKGSK